MTAPEPGAVGDQRLAERLTRLEQQIRSFRALHVSEVGDLAKQLQTLVTIHADELQLVQDELSQILAEIVARRADGTTSAQRDLPPQGDPAANSPKRAAWLAAEELRRSPKSRRELLFGGERDGKDDPGLPSS